MSGSADPFAWLGLLQWSLKYSDGTHPSSPDTITPMSPEDKAFLEMVMKEGIIDENERMKTILYEVTQQLELWKTQSSSVDTMTTAVNNTMDNDESVDRMYELLQELRDIVEQIDYARAFMSMKGIVFLLGCIENKEQMYLPISIRQLSCAIIATLCQHNPPVQKECIELGALKILYHVLDQSSTVLQNYHNTTTTTTTNNNNNIKNYNNNTSNGTDESIQANALFCERIIQAISAMVRSYDLAEHVFCQLEQANDIFRLGLVGANTVLPPLNVRKRTLFFLRALITSDTTSMQRIQQFQSHIVYAIDNILLLPKESGATTTTTNVDDEMIEMVLGMIQQLLEQRVSVNAVLTRKQPLAATAVHRISTLRKQLSHTDATDDDHEDGSQIELESWERILSLLADAKPDTPIPPINE